MLFLTLLTSAFADDRFLPWTYAAQTEGENEVEVEHYLTLETPTVAGSTSTSWEHQVEIEYGISNRLEAGAYVVASQDDEGPLTFSGYKARLRYRLGPAAGALVESCVYLEYVGSPTLKDHELEGRLILSKAAGRVHTALNLTAEWHFGEANEGVYEPTGGAMYAVVPRAWLGAEGKLEGALGGGRVEAPMAWAGPAIHLVGIDDDDDGDEEGRVGVMWTAGVMFGLTPASREDALVEVRSLLALEL